MNPDLDKLQPYPFEKLNALMAGVTPPPKAAIALSIGEPKHATPGLVAAALRDQLDQGLASYPLTKGLPALRARIRPAIRVRVCHSSACHLHFRCRIVIAVLERFD